MTDVETAAATLSAEAAPPASRPQLETRPGPIATFLFLALVAAGVLYGGAGPGPGPAGG